MWFVISGIVLLIVVPMVLDEWEYRYGPKVRVYRFRMDVLQDPQTKIEVGRTYFTMLPGQARDTNTSWRIPRTDGSVLVLRPVVLFHPWRDVWAWRVLEVRQPGDSP